MTGNISLIWFDFLWQRYSSKDHNQASTSDRKRDYFIIGGEERRSLPSCILYHMLMKLMVELRWQLAAEHQSESSQMEGSYVWGSAGRRCLKSHVSSSSDVKKKDPFRFYPGLILFSVCVCVCVSPSAWEHARRHFSLPGTFLRERCFGLEGGSAPTFPRCPAELMRAPFRATALWTRVLANDVYGFHAWQSECLGSLQIGLSGVRPRTPGAPAALLRTLSHLPGPRLARCRPLPAWKSFPRQRVLWPPSGLHLPRRGELSPPVRLHVLPAQQSQQQRQPGPQQVRADRYVRRSKRLLYH